MSRWFYLCIALAAGEAIGLIPGGCYFLWTISIFLILVVALWGYGWELRGWPLLVVMLIGFSLAGRFTQAREDLYRDKFWLRGKLEYLQRQKMDMPLAVKLSGIKEELSRRVGIGLEHSPNAAALNRAVLLGERSKIDVKVKRIFVESGTMHIFAISGLHVMIIAQVFLLILRCLMCPLRLSSALTIPLLWFYVAIIGFPPSAIRAVTMATLYFSAPIFYRRPNGLLAWAQTFLIVHIISPEMLANVGSLLSFTVMLGILGCGELIARDKAISNTTIWRRMVGEFLIISLAAWVVGVPIVAHVFGRITPGGLLANLILIPAAWYGVFSGVMGVLMSFVSEMVASHFNNFFALIMEGMTLIAELVSRLPGANFEIRAWTLWECFAWYAVIGLSIWLYRSIRSRKLF